jgi:ribosomal protein S18 acetylase RimI-like enzyme
MTERTSLEIPLLVETSIEGMQIYCGMDDDLAGQLVKKSRQKVIKAATPKDASMRFKDRESLEQWLANGRDVYSLYDREDLAGVVWYGEKEFPLHVTKGHLPWHTFAIRMYNQYRGKGFAEPFMRDSLKDYLINLGGRGQLEDFHGLWLSTRGDNEAARGLYAKFGYQETAFANQELIMVLSESKIRGILGA